MFGQATLIDVTLVNVRYAFADLAALKKFINVVRKIDNNYNFN